MHSSLPDPPPGHEDGLNRAWRTTVQGLLVDVFGAVAITLLGEVTAPDFVLSRAYFVILAGLLVKTALTAALSYVARRLTPPATF